MNIGIMGGTFDPVHNGHLAIAEAAYEQFGLDRVWFLPNGNPPHKALADIGSSIEDRLKMVQLAIAGRTGFKLEPYEARRKSVSCSYETMEHLTERLPDYFVRCHRSFIVNRQRIRRVMLSKSLIELEQGIQLPLSRSYKPAFKEQE